ncbi:MAG TPA: Ig-like domain-containing protein [bacterium]|nr:Ig-like domain-containing protein [bacterium]
MRSTSSRTKRFTAVPTLLVALIACQEPTKSADSETSTPLSVRTTAGTLRVSVPSTSGSVRSTSGATGLSLATFGTGGDNYCAGTAPAGTYVGNVVVNSNATCNLSGSTVTGNLIARDNATLIADHNDIRGNVDLLATDLVSMSDNVIGGTILAERPKRGLDIYRNQIGGNLYAKEGTGFIGVCGNTLKTGNIFVEKNRSASILAGGDACVQFGGGNILDNYSIKVLENEVLPVTGVASNGLQVGDNQVGQDLVVLTNRGTLAKVVTRNWVRVTLQCFGNTAPFVGEPNVAQKAEGDCKAGPPVASVTVAPSTAILQQAEQKRLRATLRDASGAVLTGRTVAWKSSNRAVARVTQSGLVTAMAGGFATITATSEGKSGTAQITVTVPPPPPSNSGIWISSAEIAALPISGAAWSNVKAEADRACGTPNLANQDDRANVCIMATALVYARTLEEPYRLRVFTAIQSIVSSSYSGTCLALGRELAAYVIAAELIALQTYNPSLDEQFRAKLRELRTTVTSDAWKNLIKCHEDRPNNWGTMTGASRVAIAIYLGDQADLDRAALVFRGFLGDRTAYAGFTYGELSWQYDPAQPVGINPKGATKQGHNIDGVIPDEQRRCGAFSWPPCATGYTWEVLQGAFALAWMLHRQGYPAFEWSDRALLRAVIWLYQVANDPALGDDTWQPHLINHVYGTTYSTTTPARYGKNVGWTDWTHPPR